MLGIGAGRNFPTVLVIDDDMVSREVMATMLTMTGYTVHTAADGAESLSLLDGGECKPEIILMDAQMPGLSGAELLRALRSRSRAALYAMSASAVPEEVAECANGVLLKPFSLETLQAELERAAPQPPPVVNEAPVVRRETLEQLRGLMPDSAVKQIYAAVVADLDKRMIALQKAIDRRDGAEVRRIGHAIKGGCGMAGALEAARLGELLENGGDELEYSRALLPRLRAANGNLQRMLDAEFPPPGIQSPV